MKLIGLFAALCVCFGCSSDEKKDEAKGAAKKEVANNEAKAAGTSGRPSAGANTDQATPPGKPGSDTVKTAAATTLRGVCEKATACGCNNWKTVDKCITGFSGGQQTPAPIVSCMGALSCDELCRTTKPQQCVQAYMKKASAAAKREHKMIMDSINAWPSGGGSKCPYGYKFDGYNCVKK